MKIPTTVVARCGAGGGGRLSSLAEPRADRARGYKARCAREKSLLGNVQFGGPAEKQSTLGRHVHKILAVRGNYILPIFVDRAVRRGDRTGAQDASRLGVARRVRRPASLFFRET